MDPEVEGQEYQEMIDHPPSHPVAEEEMTESLVGPVPQQLGSKSPALDAGVKQKTEEVQSAVGTDYIEVGQAIQPLMIANVEEELSSARSVSERSESSKKDEQEAMSVISTAEEDGPDEVERGELGVNRPRIIPNPFDEWRDLKVPPAYVIALLMQFGPHLSRDETGPLWISLSHEHSSSSYYRIHIEYLVTRVTAFRFLLRDQLFENTVVRMPALPHPEVGVAILDWFYTNKITKGDSDPSGEKVLECIKYLGGRVDGLRLLDRLSSDENRLTSSVLEPNTTISSMIRHPLDGNHEIQAFHSSQEENCNVTFTFKECARIGAEILCRLLSYPTISDETKTMAETLFLSYKESCRLLEDILPTVILQVFIYIYST
jgi:hypothetical protein